MTDIDQTVVLPKQRATEEDQPPPPRQDVWLEGSARGVATVGGLGSTEAALGRLAWLVTMVTVATVGLVRTSWASLSSVELSTWAVANMSWGQLWAIRSELDAAAAPYYFLIRGWAAIAGSSEFSLRVPSLVAVVLAAGAASAMVCRLVNPHAGLLAGLVIAALPATSRYAHEAGPAPMAVLVAVVATVALVWFFERPGLLRWFGYLGTLLLSAVVPVTTLVLLLGHGVAVVALRRRASPAWAAAALIGAVPAAAVMVVARTPWDLPDWAEPAGLPAVSQLVDSLFGVAVLGGVVVGLGLIAVSMRRPAGAFTAVALAPLVLLYPASVMTSLDVSMLLLMSVPFWVCLAAMALERAPFVRGLVVVIVVALVGLPTQLDLRRADGHGLAAREVAAILNAQVQPGDAIVYGPGQVDQQTGRDLVARYVVEDALPDDVLLERAPRTSGSWEGTECVEVERCVNDAPRLWLFRADEEPDPLEGMPAAKDGLLRVRYERTRIWEVTGASLSLFTLAPADLDRPAPR